MELIPNMEINYNNLSKSLGKELIKAAAKCKVRECDETEPGQFIAYVDEGNDTFDVSVTVDQGQKFTTHTCDCKSTRKICPHKAALMLHIAGGSETRTKAVRKVKIRESDTLADAADPSAILAWLKQQFNINKELELAFLSAFRTQDIQPDPETIRNSSNEAQKAVIGRLQRLDARSVTKLMSLWATIHEPVRKFYAEHPADENAFMCFMEITDVMVRFRERHYVNSAKFTTAFEEHLNLPIKVLEALEDETSWQQAANLFVKHAFEPVGAARMMVEKLMSNLQAFPAHRKKSITILMLTAMTSVRKTDRFSFAMTITFLLKLVLEQKLFGEYQHLFERINYGPHDDLLLEALIKHEQYDRAVAMALPYATMHLYPAEQLRALETLKQIYTITGEQQGLTETLKMLVPLNYNFDDYQQLLERVDASEAEKIRVPILHKAISAMHVRRDLFDFIFKVLAQQKEYDKMIRYLPKALSYEAIIPWFETLAVFNREATFQAMLTLSDMHFNQAARKPVAKLVDLTMELYTIEYLQKELAKLLTRYHVLAANSYVRGLAERFEF
ncbi:MAG: hypothetical protein EOO04_04725 [Chitinophagaceae bacterium]|nr:MAG: hypothetical protein EOO04_04725 [Chitinophagaceae bacterium]